MKPLLIAADERSQKNIDTVLALYDEMIRKRKATEAVEKYLNPEYIQHNPLIPTGAKALGEAFTYFATQHPLLRVEVYKVIAAGDYAFAHVNFFNVFSDDPNDRGTAGVDIYRFNEEGKIIEHWDVLQAVPDPATSANTNGMF